MLALSLSEKQVLRILGPKRKYIIEGRRKLYTALLYLYVLPKITCMIKSRRMKWLRQAPSKEQLRNMYIIFVKKCIEQN
jgi:hypothetical protein